LAKKHDTLSRRHFFGLVIGGGVVAGLVAGSKRISPPLLRPPGAQLEQDFLAACIRCGQCVEACPYDTLLLAGVTEGASLGTPYLVARENPCYLCQNYGEMRCIPACPSGALQPVAEKSDVRMGVAVIDQDKCLAWNGVVCRACWHACPFPDAAIELDLRGRAIIIEDACVGCGICVHACLTEPTSITIVPTGSGGHA
jgi:ferredoxin-type protein NapG